MASKLKKIINIGLDSDDSLSGGLDQSNTKLNTDDIINGSSLRYEGGVESDFGLLTDFSRAAPQFPNRFFPSDAGFDSDILTVVRTDANTFINNVGSKKTFATLGGLTPVELGINVFKSLDSSSSLIDPLNPNA